MTIIIKDSDEADARMQRVVQAIWDLWIKEKLTYEDCLWSLKLLDWEIKKGYTESIGGVRD